MPKGAVKLRVALLSLMEGVSGDLTSPRGMLTIGGHSLLRHQIGLVLALGCKRIVVMAETLTGDIVSLQHFSEARGARFHVVAAVRALAPLVAPEDDLFVIGEGLLAMPEDALRMLGENQGVLTLPVEKGLALGFERIDINSAYAGAMHLPGRLIAGLGDLPTEWNPASALLRLAMQARVVQRQISAPLVDEGRWLLVRDEAQAHRAEPGWVSLHIKSYDAHTPGRWLASLAVRRFGPALLHAGTRPTVITMASLLTAIFGMGAGWFGWHTIGFAMLGFAWLLHQAAVLLTQVELSSLLVRPGRAPAARLASWGIDAALVTLCAWRSDILSLARSPLEIGWFTPIVLLLAVRLLPAVLRPNPWLWWLSDRLIIALTLAAICALMPFDAALRVSVLVLMVGGLIASSRDSALPNSELTTGP